MNKPKKWAIQLGITAMLLPIAFTTGENTTYANGKTGQVTTQQVAQAQKQLTIKVSSLNIRKSASFSSSVVGVAKKGQTYNVIGQQNGLYQIGKNQWVSAKSRYVTVKNGTTNVTKTSVSPTTQTVTIKASNLNVRKSASFSSSVVKTVKKGQSFNILATKNGLYQIGQNQWISANTKYVTSKSGKAVAVKQTDAPKVAQTTATTQGSKIVREAKKYIGTRYAWGGKSPSGFDCSGLVYYAFKQAGYNKGYMTTSSIWSKAKKVSNPQVGDLVFLQNTYKKGVSHVGIYVGNGQMIHAGSDGVEIVKLSNSYYKKHFLGYGRL